MRVVRPILALAAGVACLSLAQDGARSASVASLKRDGTLEIAGHRLQCGNVRSKLDPALPNLGLAIPDAHLLIINPALLAHQPETVRLFVFHHECGHHHVGGSELKADCWAVQRGVEQGWLNRGDLGKICSSFGNAPETATHPAAARRCINVNRCFAAAYAERARLDAARKPHEPEALQVAASSGPRLVSGPRLIRQGTVR